MGIVDAFNREDRVELKVSEVVDYFRVEGRTNAINEILINGLKNDISAKILLKLVEKPNETKEIKK